MDDFNIIILNKELTDEYGILKDNLDEENTYLSIEINNIPKILSKIIINQKIFIPTKSSDIEKINIIYFTNLKEYKVLLEFIGKCISKLPLCNDFDLILFKYIEEFYATSCELNLYNMINKMKKIKMKK